MKQRVISAFLMALIGIPLFIIGGIVFEFGVLLLSIVVLKEILDTIEVKKELPFFIKFLCYLLLGIFLLFHVFVHTSISYGWIALFFLTFFIPVLIYQKQEKYSVVDSFYLTSIVFFLGMVFASILNFRMYHSTYFIYILLITILTDTYAYIVGMLIGSHKLMPSISPKKTWEGAIGGSVFATFIATFYFHNVISFTFPLFLSVLFTFFLSVIGQIGDLFFSAMKRYYGKKDFSNLIPGHGGLLDRMDSFIFVLLACVIFMPFI